MSTCIMGGRIAEPIRPLSMTPNKVNHEQRYFKSGSIEHRSIHFLLLGEWGFTQWIFDNPLPPLKNMEVSWDDYSQYMEKLN